MRGVICAHVQLSSEQGGGDSGGNTNRPPSQERLPALPAKSVIPSNLPEVLRSFVVPESSVKLQEAIGRGCYGVVFKGTLGKRSICVKVWGVPVVLKPGDD